MATSLANELAYNSSQLFSANADLNQYNTLRSFAITMDGVTVAAPSPVSGYDLEFTIKGLNLYMKAYKHKYKISTTHKCTGL